MQCKYNPTDHEGNHGNIGVFCSIIQGYCQFQNCHFGPKCPIYRKDWDQSWIDRQPSPVSINLIQTNNIFQENLPESERETGYPSDIDTCTTDILNIELD